MKLRPKPQRLRAALIAAENDNQLQAIYCPHERTLTVELAGQILLLIDNVRHNPLRICGGPNAKQEGNDNALH